ncbi:SCO family protein [Jiulongibacter sediminis]|uniref:SCO family protein n=1 Tax=Jiulongibacter sediminis TaxID=1605367 RepID=UPI0026EE7A5F|nr:SCO family protein [Jiulongibacter sediminis]
MSKRLLKAGILIAVLVLPAFVFIFLNVFGENRFDLPYYFPELDESGRPQVVSGDTVFHRVPDFTLINQNNQEIALKDLSDIKIANFFFTRCGTICPLMNSNIARVQNQFDHTAKVSFISISIDPEHDSVMVLKDYAATFDAVESNWNFLTGKKDYIYDLAIKGFKLPVSDASVYDPEITDIDDAFIHSEKALLLDKDNYIRGIYDATSKPDMERLNVEIKVLLDSYEKQ